MKVITDSKFINRDGHKLNYHQRSKILQLWTSKVVPKQIALRTGVSIKSIRRLIRRGSPREKSRIAKPLKSLKLTDLHIIDEQIASNKGKIAANKIRDYLQTKTGTHVCTKTIGNARRRLGWVRTGIRYCQLINNYNIPVRFAWALQSLVDDQRFLNDIEFDECSICLNPKTRAVSFRREGCRPFLEPVPKHSLKVHLLGGISRYGRTPLIIFKGNLNAEFLINIFRSSILPWLDKVLFSIYL